MDPLLKREGNGVAVSLQFGYSQAINHGEQVKAYSSDKRNL
jgi:hypothetical protein